MDECSRLIHGVQLATPNVNTFHGTTCIIDRVMADLEIWCKKERQGIATWAIRYIRSAHASAETTDHRANRALSILTDSTFIAFVSTQERTKSWSHKQFLTAMNEKQILAEIDAAHEMGIETYVLDVVRFESTGNWRVSKKRFPNGRGPVKQKLDARVGGMVEAYDKIDPATGEGLIVFFTGRKLERFWGGDNDTVTIPARACITSRATGVSTAYKSICGDGCEEGGI